MLITLFKTLLLVIDRFYTIETICSSLSLFDIPFSNMSLVTLNSIIIHCNINQNYFYVICSWYKSWFLHSSYAILELEKRNNGTHIKQ